MARFVLLRASKDKRCSVLRACSVNPLTSLLPGTPLATLRGRVVSKTRSYRILPDRSVSVGRPGASGPHLARIGNADSTNPRPRGATPFGDSAGPRPGPNLCADSAAGPASGPSPPARSTWPMPLQESSSRRQDQTGVKGTACRSRCWCPACWTASEPGDPVTPVDDRRRSAPQLDRRIDRGRETGPSGSALAP
jgi:hypothetical protein